MSWKHRAEDAAQPDAQLLPIGIVRPTHADDAPSRISQILVTQNPVALGLFELAECFAEFRYAIELDDDMEVLDQDIDIVMVSTYADVYLSSNLERTD